MPPKALTLKMATAMFAKTFNAVYSQEQVPAYVGLAMCCARAKQHMHTKFSLQKYKEGNNLGYLWGIILNKS
jgi:hypothetical protein